MITESTLMQGVIATVFGGKKGADNYKKLTAPMRVKTVPFEPPVKGQQEGTGDGKS